MIVVLSWAVVTDVIWGAIAIDWIVFCVDGWRIKANLGLIPRIEECLRTSPNITILIWHN